MKTFKSTPINNEVRCNCTHSWSDDLKTEASDLRNIRIIFHKGECHKCGYIYWKLVRHGDGTYENF